MVTGRHELNEMLTMQVKYSDLEVAFMFVNGSEPLMSSAAICKQIGKVLFASELGDTDEDFPEEFDDENHWFIPHATDLDCLSGAALVRSFVSDVAPHLSDQVDEIFSRRGAFRRFKDLLDEVDLRDAWHRYEEQHHRAALLRWCEENSLPVVTDD